MTNQRTKRNEQAIVDRLMNERVPMLGMPQIVVTRGFCYQWLKANGWDRKAKGFASLDYAAFGRPTTDAALTDEAERDSLLSLMAEQIKKAA